MKKKVIYILSCISILLILIFTAILITKKINDKSYGKYIPLYKRNTSVILDVNENLLDEYISKKDSMVVFFATWCHYCVEEAEELNNFILANPKIPVIIVSHDTIKNELESFLNDRGYNWFVIFDKEKNIREHIDPDSYGIPSVYLIDKELNILNYYKGILNQNDFLDFYNQKKITKEE